MRMARRRGALLRQWQRVRFSRKIPRKTGGRKKKDPLPRLVLIGLLVIAFLAGMTWLRERFQPILAQMAGVKVDYLASKAINDAITRKITQENIEYGNLIVFEKDSQGQITALKTDMIAINRLKTGITDDVLEALHGVGVSDLSIPLGNLTGSDLLSGRGPSIPVRIVPLGMVSAGFSNQLSDAGINQTRHQVMMDIQVSVEVLLPGYNTQRQIAAQVCVAETVIVGSVPDSYLNLSPDKA